MLGNISDWTYRSYEAGVWDVIPVADFNNALKNPLVTNSTPITGYDITNSFSVNAKPIGSNDDDPWTVSLTLATDVSTDTPLWTDESGSEPPFPLDGIVDLLTLQVHPPESLLNWTESDNGTVSAKWKAGSQGSLYGTSADWIVSVGAVLDLPSEWYASAGGFSNGSCETLLPQPCYSDLMDDVEFGNQWQEGILPPSCSNETEVADSDTTLLGTGTTMFGTHKHNTGTLSASFGPAQDDTATSPLFAVASTSKSHTGEVLSFAQDWRDRSGESFTHSGNGELKAYGLRGRVIPVIVRFSYGGDSASHSSDVPEGEGGGSTLVCLSVESDETRGEVDYDAPLVQEQKDAEQAAAAEAEDEDGENGAVRGMVSCGTWGVVVLGVVAVVLG